MPDSSFESLVKTLDALNPLNVLASLVSKRETPATPIPTPPLPPPPHPLAPPGKPDWEYKGKDRMLEQVPTLPTVDGNPAIPVIKTSPVSSDIIKLRSTRLERNQPDPQTPIPNLTSWYSRHPAVGARWHNESYNEDSKQNRSTLKGFNSTYNDVWTPQQNQNRGFKKGDGFFNEAAQVSPNTTKKVTSGLGSSRVWPDTTVTRNPYPWRLGTIQVETQAPKRKGKGNIFG